MDAFAAAHDGLAPVVVIADLNGSDSGNTMCMDAMTARADTYLSVDVPAWIRATLHVDPDPARWAVGGFSFGGTCALILPVSDRFQRRKLHRPSARTAPPPLTGPSTVTTPPSMPWRP
ncbi:MAG: hypothetical protein NVS2B15_07440 [Pseudarthrobacter sp.]